MALLRLSSGAVSAARGGMPRVEVKVSVRRYRCESRAARRDQGKHMALVGRSLLSREI